MTFKYSNVWCAIGVLDVIKLRNDTMPLFYAGHYQIQAFAVTMADNVKQ